MSIEDYFNNIKLILCDCGSTGGCRRCRPEMFGLSNLPLNPYLPMGWECPRCHTINTPWKSKCDCPIIGTAGILSDD